MPLSLGDFAQPGSTKAGRSPMRPRQIRLPGSTGIPKCRISPPAATIAAGPTSRRSTTAEAPAISSISAPCAISASSAATTGASSCGTRRAGSSVPVRRFTRSVVTAIAFSVALSFMPGSSVTTRPTWSGRNGCRVSAGPPCRAIAATTSRTAPGTAKGTTLMVATRSLAATTA